MRSSISERFCFDSSMKSLNFDSISISEEFVSEIIWLFIVSSCVVLSVIVFKSSALNFFSACTFSTSC